jgi:transcriptional regulator with XRE-family HTH domain
MNPAISYLPVAFRAAKRIAAVGMAASTVAPTAGGAMTFVEARAWTASPVEFTQSPTIQSTTGGPMRFEDALDNRATVVGLGPAGVASADSIRTIYERSGLTWEQLARLFGVSRRAVHAWASGSRVSARHFEAIYDLAGRLTQRVGDAEENRAWLLDSSAGPSVYEQMRRANTRKPMEARLTPSELMGIK